MAKPIDETLGTGRRKRAVSSIRLRDGNGNIDVNGRKFEEYFPLEIQRATILAPLKMIDAERKFDLLIRVNGGGIEGQVIASRLGLTRALVKLNENLKHDFKVEGFLTRDPRKKERKKFGHKKARKSFQFSKR